MVAIIALLIAILLPALNLARAQARQSVCLANLKEIGSGMTMYMGTYRNWLPVGPADRVRYQDKTTGIYYDEPSVNRRIVPWFTCSWGGKRAAYSHDWQSPPRPEVTKRPLTSMLYRGAGLDTPMPLFQCPSDTGFEPADTYWLPSAMRDLQSYEACGNSYYINPWHWTGAQEGIESNQRRLRIPSVLILAEDAPLFFSVDNNRQYRGWHTKYATHNTLFLDFHAKGVYINPQGTREAPEKQWRGPGWFAVNYFDIMDYYE